MLLNMHHTRQEASHPKAPDQSRRGANFSTGTSVRSGNSALARSLSSKACRTASLGSQSRRVWRVVDHSAWFKDFRSTWRVQAQTSAAHEGCLQLRSDHSVRLLFLGGIPGAMHVLGHTEHALKAGLPSQLSRKTSCTIFGRTSAHMGYHFLPGSQPGRPCYALRPNTLPAYGILFSRVCPNWTGGLCKALRMQACCNWLQQLPGWPACHGKTPAMVLWCGLLKAQPEAPFLRLRIAGVLQKRTVCAARALSQKCSAGPQHDMCTSGTSSKAEQAMYVGPSAPMVTSPCPNTYSQRPLTSQARKIQFLLKLQCSTQSAP